MEMIGCRDELRVWWPNAKVMLMREIKRRKSREREDLERERE